MYKKCYTYMYMYEQSCSKEQFKAKGKMYVCGIRNLGNFKDSTLVLQFLSFQQDIQNDRK